MSSTPAQINTLPVRRLKRAFDVVVALSVLILTSPLFLLFLALIFLEHTFRGRPLDPLFYREVRISRGMPFMLIKFNIFDQRVVDAMRAKGEFIHTKHLEWNRQTIFIGRMLRQIYLDELPQLFNVLRGELSIVGPRPINLQVYEEDSQNFVPAQRLVTAGMTGLFQSYKGTEGMSSQELNTEYVRQYARRRGLSLVWYDLWIIARTVKVLLQAKGN